MSAYALAFKLKIPVILPEWEQTKKLRAESEKLWAESENLRAESEKLWAESIKLWDEGNKLWAESKKLWDEGDKLWAEGNKLYIDAVEREFGTINNLRVNWNTGEISGIGV